MCCSLPACGCRFGAWAWAFTCCCCWGGDKVEKLTNTRNLFSPYRMGYHAIGSGAVCSLVALAVTPIPSGWRRGSDAVGPAGAPSPGSRRGRLAVRAVRLQLQRAAGRQLLHSAHHAGVALQVKGPILRACHSRVSDAFGSRRSHLPL